MMLEELNWKKKNKIKKNKIKDAKDKLNRYTTTHNKNYFLKAMLVTHPHGNAFSGITQSSFFVKYTFMKRRY